MIKIETIDLIMISTLSLAVLAIVIGTIIQQLVRG